jgi:hypothetical protein
MWKRETHFGPLLCLWWTCFVAVEKDHIAEVPCLFLLVFQTVSEASVPTFGFTSHFSNLRLH